MTKEDLKIVFFGTPEFAVESLDTLVKNGFNVAAVVTMPDKIAGRGHKLITSAVKDYAVSHGLPLLQPEKLKSEEFVNRLREIDAQLFIVIAFRMLPEVVWTMPPLGTFNLHASLLPRYRGAAPINRAIMNGDTVTGVTTFMLKHEIDTGDILAQERVEILPDEDFGSLYDRLMHVGARLTLDTVRHIIAGDLKPVAQDALTGGKTPTPAPKIFAEDCEIDWTRPAADIHNQVRGLSPVPAARAELRSAHAKPEQMKIYRTRLSEICPGGTPGTAEVIGKKRLVVACGDGNGLELLELQPSGKKRMETGAWLAGARLVDPYFVTKDGN
ncbi:MAG: methionyl-tRNA formyltransferase [Muribaculaceae bacterium]|nr:methionyl-tRNA formyltransferase [Muribaculaceae bacterium]